MAVDGTVFNTPDTPANDLAFGRSRNQYGKGAYPQVRCVLLSECGTHSVVGVQMSGYEVSEVHGAYQVLSQIGPNHVVTMDAGITSGGMVERIREQHGHAVGVLEPGVWEGLPTHPNVKKS